MNKIYYVEKLVSELLHLTKQLVNDNLTLSSNGIKMKYACNMINVLSLWAIISDWKTESLLYLGL